MVPAREELVEPIDELTGRARLPDSGGVVSTWTNPFSGDRDAPPFLTISANQSCAIRGGRGSGSRARRARRRSRAPPRRTILPSRRPGRLSGAVRPRPARQHRHAVAKLCAACCAQTVRPAGTTCRPCFAPRQFPGRRTGCVHQVEVVDGSGITNHASDLKRKDSAPAARMTRHRPAPAPFARVDLLRSFVMWTLMRPEYFARAADFALFEFEV